MEMGRALELLGSFTAEQWGMVTSRQAKKLGVDGVTLHRLKDAGFLEPVRRGVYAASAAVATEAREEQAAWLALNPAVPGWERTPLDSAGGVVSHQSAARLHGVGELPNRRTTMTTPRRRTSRDPDLWFKINTLIDTDVTVIDGLPITTVLRTVCDLLDQHIDASHIATIIRQAVNAGQLRLDTLAEQIGPYSRSYRARPGDGEALLEHLLAQIGLTTATLVSRPAPPRFAAVTAAQHELLGGIVAPARPLMSNYSSPRAFTGLTHDAGVGGILSDAAKNAGVGSILSDMAKHAGISSVFSDMAKNAGLGIAANGLPALGFVHPAASIFANGTGHPHEQATRLSPEPGYVGRTQAIESTDSGYKKDAADDIKDHGK